MQKEYQNFSFNRKQDEMISIRLKGNDVNVFLLDSFGKEVPVTDVDLELELPARFRCKPDPLESILPTFCDFIVSGDKNRL